MIRPLSAALLATSLFCAPALAQSVPPAIAAAVADASRPDTDKERDAARKPATEELAVLTTRFDSRLARYRQNPDAAKQLINQGSTPETVTSTRKV